MSSRVYVPASEAQAMSEALFALSRPAAVRLENEVTNARCACEKDTGGNTWLVVNTATQILIHPQAELNDIATHLQPLEDDGRLPAGTIEGLAVFVSAHRGQTITMWDAFPTYFKTNSLTYEQMLEQGKLNQPQFS